MPDYLVQGKRVFEDLLLVTAADSFTAMQTYRDQTTNREPVTTVRTRLVEQTPQMALRIMSGFPDLVVPPDLPAAPDLLAAPDLPADLPVAETVAAVSAVPDTGRYLGDFTCQEDVEREFDMRLKRTQHILLAAYGNECYSGQAFVLAEEDGRLLEVNASHCSCYGLEGQYEPEDTSTAALRRREWSTYREYNTDEFRKALTAVLDDWDWSHQPHRAAA